MATPCALATAALALLVAGCPVDPVIGVIGLQCSADTDCNTPGVVCTGGTCAPAGNGGTSGGSSSGGTGGLCATDGGSRPVGPNGQFYPCNVDGDCACGLSCQVDSAYNYLTGATGTLCLQSCLAQSDCTLSNKSYCWSGYCQYAICGGFDGGLGHLPTAYIPLYGYCTFRHKDDAFCVPASSNPLYGYCFLGGDAGLGSPAGCRAATVIPQISCEVGDFCFADAGCEQLCNPLDAGCPAGEGCVNALQDLLFTCQAVDAG